MKTCFYCKSQILEEENHCDLISYSKGGVSNIDSWHEECFKNWLEEKMDKKVQEYANKMMEFAKPVVESKFAEYC